MNIKVTIDNVEQLLTNLVCVLNNSMMERPSISGGIGIPAMSRNVGQISIFSTISDILKNIHILLYNIINHDTKLLYKILCSLSD